MSSITITKLARLTEISQNLKQVKIQMFFSNFLITAPRGLLGVQIFDYKSISRVFGIEIKKQRRKILWWFKLLNYLLENHIIERVDYDYRIKVIFANKKALMYNDIDYVLSLFGEV